MNDVTDEEAAEKKDPLKTCTPPQIECCCYLLHNIKLGFWLPVFLSLLITIHNSSCRREGGRCAWYLVLKLKNLRTATVKFEF
jgi:hypothetical protein